MRGIHRELFYPHPPERVWRTLTEPALISRWLMDVEAFEPRVGCRFQFITKPAPGFDGVIHCEVLEADPPRRLSYSWRSGRAKTPTTVLWQLVREGEGTRLVFDHTGFRGPGGFFVRTLLGRGWGHKLRDYLPLLLERVARVSDVSTIDREGLLEC